MLLQYIQASMRKARYEILPEEGAYYGEIPAFDGVYGHASQLEACREEMEEVLEEWEAYSRPRPLSGLCGAGASPAGGRGARETRRHLHRAPSPHRHPGVPSKHFNPRISPHFGCPEGKEPGWRMVKKEKQAKSLRKHWEANILDVTPILQLQNLG
jgi:predicted RNase H-like HicB family nuclease